MAVIGEKIRVEDCVELDGGGDGDEEQGREEEERCGGGEEAAKEREVEREGEESGSGGEVEKLRGVKGGFVCGGIAQDDGVIVPD